MIEFLLSFIFHFIFILKRVKWRTKTNCAHPTGVGYGDDNDELFKKSKINQKEDRLTMLENFV